MVALCEDVNQAEMTGRQTQNGRGARNGGTFTFKPKSLCFPISVFPGECGRHYLSSEDFIYHPSTLLHTNDYILALGNYDDWIHLGNKSHADLYCSLACRLHLLCVACCLLPLATLENHLEPAGDNVFTVI